MTGKNQFSIKYGGGSSYNPDFIVQKQDEVIIAEVKNQNEMNDDIVTAKANAADQWVRFVNEIATRTDKNHWRYLLIPDNDISSFATLDGLISDHAYQTNN